MMDIHCFVFVVFSREITNKMIGSLKIRVPQIEAEAKQLGSAPDQGKLPPDPLANAKKKLAQHVHILFLTSTTEKQSAK